MCSIFFSMGVVELPQILLQPALYMYACTVLFIFRKITLQRIAPSVSRISLWSMGIKCGSKTRIARQPSLW